MKSLEGLSQTQLIPVTLTFFTDPSMEALDTGTLEGSIEVEAGSTILTGLGNATITNLTVMTRETG